MDSFQQVQHCTGLPIQVTFPAHTEQEKKESGLGRTLPLNRRRREMRRWAREGKEKKENKRPILKVLRAALLRSIRGQRGRKIVCLKGVPG